MNNNKMDYFGCEINYSCNECECFESDTSSKKEFLCCNYCFNNVICCEECTKNNESFGGRAMKQFNIEEMENYEVNEIKDDLVMLESQFEGSRDGDVLAKAFHYINYLEEKLVDISSNKERAIRLLSDNGYFIGKITGAMERDSKVCEKQNYEGDCSCCSCSICIMQ